MSSTPGGADEFFKTATLSGETFADLLRSPDLLGQVADEAVTRGLPSYPPDQMIRYIKIDPSSDSDSVNLLLAARDPAVAVGLLNLYASNAVVFTREMQARQARAVANNYLKFQVDRMDDDINVLIDQFRHAGVSGEVTNKLNEVGANLSALNQSLAATPHSSALIEMQTERLNKALGELGELNAKYTALHPAVQEKQSEIDSIKWQIAQESTNASGAAIAAPAAPPAAAPASRTANPEADIVQARLRSLEDGRVRLATREREAESYAKNPPGMVRVLVPATMATVKSNLRWFKITLVSIFGGFMGLGASLGVILIVELADSRIRTADDVRRVTKLPVIGALDDLSQMGQEARSRWAFRTWIMLQGRLSPSANHGLVCGITSSTDGEGRSTWINLLAEAASLAGFRVLTIATRPSPTHVASTDDTLDESLLEDASQISAQDRSLAVANAVLSSPAKLTEQLTGPDSRPVVHIPLPGWVWNLERRKQWRDALNHWKKIDNLVILVELPPASVAEAVLLGSNLPNLLWLAESGTAEASETRAQLETLRDARCNLAGAVLNREPAMPVRLRFPRWLE